MSRQVKISIDLTAVNNRVNNRRGVTCLTHCPKLEEKNDAGVTWRQVRFCPIKAIALMPDVAPCEYGRRLIASAQVKKSVEKSKSRQTSVNGPTSAPRKRGKNGRQNP